MSSILSNTSKDRKNSIISNIDISRVFLDNAKDITSNNKSFLDEINLDNQKFVRKFTSIEILNSAPTTYDNRRSIIDSDNKLPNKITKISDEISTKLLNSSNIAKDNISNDYEQTPIDLEVSTISPPSYQFDQSSTYNDSFTIPNNLFIPSMNRSLSPYKQQFNISLQTNESAINEDDKQLIDNSLATKDGNFRINTSTYVGDSGIDIPGINMTEMQMFDSWYLFIYLS
jgi:hypothetical protein